MTTGYLEIVFKDGIKIGRNQVQNGLFDEVNSEDR